MSKYIRCGITWGTCMLRSAYRDQPHQCGEDNTVSLCRGFKDHDWGGWNQWTNTCISSRSRICRRCHEIESQTRTDHDFQWNIIRGHRIKSCRKCGQLA